jgi:hypothetical protein
MKVVTSANAGYLRLLDLWLAQSARHLSSRLVVGCMDTAALEHCAARGDVEGVPVPDPAAPGLGRYAFWLRRLDFLRRFVDRGEDIVHTDIDAFWLESPWQLLDGFDDDLIISRERGIPYHLARRWGFVLCCGFYRLRATNASRAFLATWRRKLSAGTSDQITFNTVLHGLRPTWMTVETALGEGHRCRVRIDGHELSVLALPEAAVTREAPYLTADAVVAHPYFARQHFGSHVSLLAFVLERTGAVNGLRVLARQRAEATAEALAWRLERDPSCADNWAHLGALLLARGDRDAAAAAFGQALDRGLADPGGRLGLAEGLAALGRRDDALAVLPAGAGPEVEMPVARGMAAVLLRLGAYRRGLALAWELVDRAGLRGTATMAVRAAAERLRGERGT